jgi:hypothetical protein
MLFKNSYRTSKRTPHFTITTINWLTMFKEIIHVYSEIQTKPICTHYEQNGESLIIKAFGTHHYRMSLKGKGLNSFREGREHF